MYGDDGEQYTTSARSTGCHTMVFLSAVMDVGDELIGSLEAEHGIGGSCGSSCRSDVTVDRVLVDQP